MNASELSKISHVIQLLQLWKGSALAESAFRQAIRNRSPGGGGGGGKETKEEFMSGKGMNTEGRGCV